MIKILLLGIFLLPLLVASQEKTREIKPGIHSYSNRVVHHNGHLYINVIDGKYFDNSVDIKKGILYKIDYNLTTVDSLQFTDYLPMYTIDAVFAGTFVGLGSKLCAQYVTHSLNSPGFPGWKGQSHFLIINKDMIVEDTVVLSRDSLSITLVDLQLAANGKILASGSGRYSKVVEPKPLLARIDTGDWSFTHAFYDSLSSNSRNFEKILPLGDSALAYTRYYVSSTSKGFRSLALIDRQNNILRSSGVFDTSGVDYRSIDFPGIFIPVSRDSIWLLGLARSFIPPGPVNSDCDKPFTADYYNLGATLLDADYNVTRIDTFPLSGYCHQNKAGIIPYRPGLKPADYRKVDSVLFIQGEQFNNYWTFPDQDSTAIWLYNFNARTGTMNWMKRFQPNYTTSAHSVAALPGNRWAVSFNMYDWDRYSGPNLSVHVWIINGEGDIISQREFDAGRPKVHLYPNPVSDHLRLEGEVSAGEYAIIGLSGKQVATGGLPASGEISVRELAPGLYFLRLIVEGRPLGYWRFQKL